ncbi:DoxX family protein [Cellulomonas soli]|uniref:DoxX family protein n=1 Tax=Cellulomonas soli TaxID=931535 RepID=UPI003F843CB3
MLLRKIARPLFATWFVAEGTDVVRHPAPHADELRATLARLPAGLLPPSLDTEPSDAVLRTAARVHGVALATAGLMVMGGRAPRTAALALAALTAPLVLANLPDRRAGHDKVQRRVRRDRLVQALTFTGAALLVAADREGRPGIAWRVGQAREARALAHAAD